VFRNKAVCRREVPDDGGDWWYRDRLETMRREAQLLDAMRSEQRKPTHEDLARIHTTWFDMTLELSESAPTERTLSGFVTALETPRSDLCPSDRDMLGERRFELFVNSFRTINPHFDPAMWADLD
jgi:hypothetical protein